MVFEGIENERLHFVPCFSDDVQCTSYNIVSTIIQLLAGVPDSAKVVLYHLQHEVSANIFDTKEFFDSSVVILAAGGVALDGLVSNVCRFHLRRKAVLESNLRSV